MRLILSLITFILGISFLFSNTKIDEPKLYKSDKISFKIDSIKVFTGVYIKRNIYTPHYRYQDSLFCNYDSLKLNSKLADNTITIMQNDSIFSQILHELMKIKVFKKNLKKSNLTLKKSNYCDIDGEISDCFEIFYNGKSLRIGVKSDNLLFCFLESKYIKINRKNKLLLQLLQLRNYKS